MSRRVCGLGGNGLSALRWLARAEHLATLHSQRQGRRPARLDAFPGAEFYIHVEWSVAVCRRQKHSSLTRERHNDRQMAVVKQASQMRLVVMAVPAGTEHAIRLYCTRKCQYKQLSRTTRRTTVSLHQRSAG